MLSFCLKHPVCLVLSGLQYVVSLNDFSSHHTTNWRTRDISFLFVATWFFDSTRSCCLYTSWSDGCFIHHFQTFVCVRPSFFILEALFLHTFIHFFGPDVNASIWIVLFCFFHSMNFHFGWIWYFRKNEALEIRGAETFCECSVDKNGRNFKFVKNVVDHSKMWVREFQFITLSWYIRQLKSWRGSLCHFTRESRQRKKCFVFADPLRESDRRLQLKRYNIAREFNRLYAALQFDARDKHYIVVSGTLFLLSLTLFCFVVLSLFVLIQFSGDEGDWGCDPLNGGDPYLKSLLLLLVISSINHNVKRLNFFATTGSMSPPSSPTSSLTKLSPEKLKSKKTEKYQRVEHLSLLLSGSLVASKLLQLNNVLRKEEVSISTPSHIEEIRNHRFCDTNEVCYFVGFLFRRNTFQIDNRMSNNINRRSSLTIESAIQTLEEGSETISKNSRKTGEETNSSAVLGRIRFTKQNNNHSKTRIFIFQNWVLFPSTKSIICFHVSTQRRAKTFSYNVSLNHATTTSKSFRNSTTSVPSDCSFWKNSTPQQR